MFGIRRTDQESGIRLQPWCHLRITCHVCHPFLPVLSTCAHGTIMHQILLRLSKLHNLFYEKNGYMEKSMAHCLLIFHHLCAVDPPTLEIHVSTCPWTEEWEACTTIDPLKVKSVQDVRAFWHASGYLPPWRCTSSNSLMNPQHPMLWKGPSTKPVCLIPSSSCQHPLLREREGSNCVISQ